MASFLGLNPPRSSYPGLRPLGLMPPLLPPTAPPKSALPGPASARRTSRQRHPRESRLGLRRPRPSHSDLCRRLCRHLRHRPSRRRPGLRRPRPSHLGLCHSGRRPSRRRSSRRRPGHSRPGPCHRGLRRRLRCHPRPSRCRPSWRRCTSTRCPGPRSCLPCYRHRPSRRQPRQSFPLCRTRCLFRRFRRRPRPIRRHPSRRIHPSWRCPGCRRPDVAPNLDEFGPPCTCRRQQRTSPSSKRERRVLGTCREKDSAVAALWRPRMAEEHPSHRRRGRARRSNFSP